MFLFLLLNSVHTEPVYSVKKAAILLEHKVKIVYLVKISIVHVFHEKANNFASTEDRNPRQCAEP